MDQSSLSTSAFQNKPAERGGKAFLTVPGAGRSCPEIYFSQRNCLRFKIVEQCGCSNNNVDDAFSQIWFEHYVYDLSERVQVRAFALKLTLSAP